MYIKVDMSKPRAPLTLRELSQELRLPEVWLQMEAEAGRIPSITVDGALRFILLDVVRALCDRASQEGLVDFHVDRSQKGESESTD